MCVIDVWLGEMRVTDLPTVTAMFSEILIYHLTVHCLTDPFFNSY